MKIFQMLAEKNIEKKILYAIVGLAAVLLFAFLLNGFDFGRFDVSFYTERNVKVDEKVRMVVISDVHLREFGKDNIRLLEKIKALNPDIIAVPGDLTIYGNKNHEPALKLLRNLKEIAPVYYSYGNHEYAEILFEKGSTLESELGSTGVQIVVNSFKEAEIKGTKFVIGGFCVGPENFGEKHREFLTKFCAQDGFKLLLTHHVECFEKVMEGFPVDLAVTGHAHGGQVRFPGIGGVFSPDQGFFPKLTEGMQELCGSTVVISRGLGNSNPFPRYNNNPEIIVVDIVNY